MNKLFVVLVLLCAGPVFATEDTPQNRLLEVDRYMAAIPLKELVANMVEGITKEKHLSPDQQAQNELFVKSLDFTAINLLYKQALLKTYTPDELKAMADYYGSSAGQSAVKKMGSFYVEFMPLFTAEVNKAMAKAKKAPRHGSP